MVKASIIAARSLRVDLLVDLLELLRLLLGDVQPDRQIVVVLNQLLNGASAVLQIS